MPPGGKYLSCKRCQYRKLKCSRTEPCTTCTLAGVDCEYRNNDKKRVPASSDYVRSLESRIAWFESFVSTLRDASPEKRDEMLGSVHLTHPPSPSRTASGHSSDPQHFDSGIQAQSDLGIGGSANYLRSTSILFTDEPTQDLNFQDTAQQHGPDHPANLAVEPESNFEHVLQYFGVTLQGDTVMKALMQFFKWQYPHFMFIYREAFLRDHFGPRQACRYWSPALLMAVCSLGLSTSNISDADRELSEQFYSAAESIVIVSGFGRPSIVTVQTFLCLAFYEIGRGNLSKGWGFSGIAFRMAQDLGVQRDPKNWISHDGLIASTEEIEIRRRIYWGCYISDKLISLILGRPVHLAYDAAEVDPIETIPDPPQMEYWRPIGFDDMSGGSDTLSSCSNIPYLKEQIRLARIIESMITTLFSPRAEQDGLSRRSHLDRLNLELSQWHASLPDFTRWNKWSATGDNLPMAFPGVATLHLLFYSTRIALNHSQATLADQGVVGEAAREYCTFSAQNILSLVRNYRLQYGLQYAPLILVYAAVQAIRTLKTVGIPEEMEYLAHALVECAQTWKIASQVPVVAGYGA